MRRNLEKVKICWSQNFAYAIGLITSDGWLSKDKRHLGFRSKDLELINTFRNAPGLKNKISKYQDDKRIYFTISFGDKIFYNFLNNLGLYNAKSKTIAKVDIPDIFFPDFLRGLFDGDGSFYNFRDKRWPNSFGFKLSFASASPSFITWLKNRISSLFDIYGYLHKGAGVINLEYTKWASKKIISVMYYSNNILFLKRKYFKIKSAMKKDKKFGLEYLQKPRGRASSAVRALP